MADQPRLLLVGMGVMGRSYVPRARARGYALSVVDNPANLDDPVVRAGWLPGDHTYPVAGAGDEAWHSAANAAVRAHRPDAVVAFSEPHVLATALIADQLGLPAPGLRTATLSRNKAYQRATFAGAGVRQPEYCLCGDADTAIAWARDRYPVVLKPLSDAGSRGIRVVDGDAEIKEWVTRGHARGPFLVEQYCDGPEYSCEILVHEGEVVFANVTAKQTTRPPLCVETGHRTPAGCTAEVEAAIVAQARAVVAAAGMRAGIGHVEMRVGPDGPVLMEIGVRTPGDYIMEMTELATGMDMFDGVLAVASGQAPVLDRRRGAAAAVWYPSFDAGAALPVAALRAAAELPGVALAEVDAQPGQLAPAVAWSLDRIIAYVVHGADEAELDARLAEVRATVGQPAPPA